MADIGNNHPEDYEQIRREWKDELNMKSRIPAEAKAEIERKYGMQTEPTNESEEDDEVNPNKPKVDNNAKYVPCILKYVRPISKYVGHIFYRMESRIPTFVVAIKNRAAGISKISCRPVNGTEFIAIIPFCR